MKYDIIVIGGGISGLNILYELAKQKTKKRVLLLEKNNYLGGRIKTFREQINKKNYQWEEGAGRFNKNHKLLINLIKELKLSSHINPIGSDIKFIPSKPIDREFYNKNPFEYVNIVVTRLEKESAEESRKYTFQEYAIKKNILTKKEFDFVLDSFGYYSELVDMNAADALRLFKDGITNKLQYYGLKCGLDQIIEKMRGIILKNKNFTIKTNTHIKNIKYIDSSFVLNSGQYFCDNLVLAIPKPNLCELDFLKPIRRGILDSIVCKPLCRIYAVYENAWFKNMGKITTNNDLRYIIPINEKSGLIMISYSDNAFAEYWKNKRKILPLINKNIRETFDIDIEDPIYIKKSYWDCGVGYWKKNVDSGKISNAMLKPFDVPLFICGENYSTTQGWIEGALITSNRVIELL